VLEAFQKFCKHCSCLLKGFLLGRAVKIFIYLYILHLSVSRRIIRDSSGVICPTYFNPEDGSFSVCRNTGKPFYILRRVFLKAELIRTRNTPSTKTHHSDIHCTSICLPSTYFRCFPNKACCVRFLMHAACPFNLDNYHLIKISVLDKDYSSFIPCRYCGIGTGGSFPAGNTAGA
jgi:hypothetical protein